MAPEVIKQTSYGRKSDIWSFGCTILEMASGEKPWSNYKFDNPIAAILTIGCGNEIPYIPERLSDDLKDFLKLCLKRNPNERLTAKQLLDHKFMQF